MGPSGCPRARPIADEKESQRAADVYVPHEYQHYDLAGVCRRLRVDVEGPFPNLKPSRSADAVLPTDKTELG